MIASISVQVSVLVLETTRYFALLAEKLFHKKKSILSSHCASKKHASGKEMIKKSKLREQTSTEALSREKSHQDSTDSHRKNIQASSFVRKNGYRLASSISLGQYIALIFKKEVARIKN